MSLDLQCVVCDICLACCNRCERPEPWVDQDHGSPLYWRSGGWFWAWPISKCHFHNLDCPFPFYQIGIPTTRNAPFVFYCTP